MSRFYASIQGERGEATRRGLKKIRAHVRGWNVGFQVNGDDSYNKPGEDVFSAALTGGSNNADVPDVVLTVDHEAVRLWKDGEVVWECKR